MNSIINEDALFRTQVRRIALSLSVACQIPIGEELIIILGTGSESSNQEALEYWVSQHLEVSEGTGLKSTLEKLKHLLIDEIKTWQHY